EHLRQMDDLRTAVQHASIEQKDPLVIYKKESYELFKTMMGKMSKEVVSFLTKAHLPAQNGQGKHQSAEDVEFEEVGHAFDKGQIQSNNQSNELQGSESMNQARQNSGQQRPKRQPIVVQPK